MLKKLTAIFLAGTMVLSGFTMAFADEQVNGYEEPPLPFTDEFDFLAETKVMGLTQTYELMAMLDVAGVSMAVVHRDSQHTWTRGIGFGDVENERAVTEHTLFDIGSVTKLFTAVAVMQLVEAGLIDLDEPITTYLPDFFIQPHPVHGGNYQNITTRMLLTHTSGLPENDMRGMGTFGEHYIDYMNNMLDSLARRHMFNAEHDRLVYSNDGFTLLGILTAEVSGFVEDGDFFNGFARYLQENIFDPVGMASTTFFPDEDNQDVSLPYPMASYPPSGRIFANTTSTGGLYSNAYDMARFMHMLLNFGEIDGNQILSQEYFEKMLAPQEFVCELSPIVQFRLGFVHANLPDGRSFTGHDGAWIHYFTNLVFDFEHGIGVFAVTNTATGAPIAGIPNAMLFSALYELYDVGYHIVTLPDAEPTELPLEEFELIAGYFPPLGWLEISEDGLLHFPHLFGPDVHLEFIPLDDGSFFTPLIPIRFWFKELNGRMVMLSGDQAMGVESERIYPWQADERLDRWMGSWRYENEVPSSIYAPEFSGDLIMTIGVNENGYAILSSMGATLKIGMADEYTIYVLGTGRGQGTVVELGIDEDGTKWLQGWGTRYTKVDLGADLAK